MIKLLVSIISVSCIFSLTFSLVHFLIENSVSKLFLTHNQHTKHIHKTNKTNKEIIEKSTYNRIARKYLKKFKFDSLIIDDGIR